MHHSSLPNASPGSTSGEEESCHTIDPAPFVAEFESAYPDIFDIYYRVGIHPARPMNIPSLYFARQFAPHRPNIGLHSVGVALCARALATALLSNPKYSKLDLNDVIRRALLHDVSKPFELMRRDLKRNDRTVYGDNAHVDIYKLLVKAGMSEEVALTIVTAGYDAGHLSVRRFLYVDQRGGLQLVAGNLPGKITFLADTLVVTSIPTATTESSSRISTPSARLLGTASRTRYPWLWEMGLGLDGDREIVEIPDVHASLPGVSVIGSYAAVQVWTARAICSELLSLGSDSIKAMNLLHPDPEVAVTSYVHREISPQVDLSIAV